MSFEESIKKGTFFGFIPHRLEIKNLPQLNIFPFNVLFVSFAIRDGINIMGSAVYEPDFKSIKKCGDEISLTYRNAYGGENWLIISYDTKEGKYTGEKFVNSKSVGMAEGVEWEMFFVHLTALGLSSGERCMFEPVS